MATEASYIHPLASYLKQQGFINTDDAIRQIGEKYNFAFIKEGPNAPLQGRFLTGETMSELLGLIQKNPVPLQAIAPRLKPPTPQTAESQALQNLALTGTRTPEAGQFALPPVVPTPEEPSPQQPITQTLATQTQAPTTQPPQAKEGSYVKVGPAFFQVKGGRLAGVADPATLRGLKGGSIPFTEQATFAGGAQRFTPEPATLPAGKQPATLPAGKQPATLPAGKQPATLPAGKQPVAPVSPTVAPGAVIAPPVTETPSITTGTQDWLTTELSKLGPGQSFEQILQGIKDTFGIDEATAGLDKLNEDLGQGIMEINENPWISEGLRSKKVAALQDKFDVKKQGLIEKMKSEQDLVGLALTAYYKERDLKKDLLFKQLDLYNEELDRRAAEAREVAQPKGFELSPGQVRYEFNAETGQYEAVANVPGKIGGANILSPTEAMALGVPYGTTEEQAYGITPQKPATEAQKIIAEYAARIEQAEPTLSKLEDYISKLGTVKFELQKKLPPSLQTTEFQQYMQASRNFINAKLRRESGAVISPTEFSEARSQYLPVAGDTKETLTLKRSNRALVYNSLKNSAGSAYQSVSELLGGSGDIISLVDEDIRDNASSYSNREALLDALIDLYPELTEAEIAKRVYTLIPDK